MKAVMVCHGLYSFSDRQLAHSRRKLVVINAECLRRLNCVAHWLNSISLPVAQRLQQVI